MKKHELIKLLQTLPEDAEICMVEGDDILGDYNYNPVLTFIEETGFKTPRGAIYTEYSNYANYDDEEVKVWVIS